MLKRPSISMMKAKRFEISARAVFRKYKACLTFKGVGAYRAEYEAINFIYKTLEDDRDKLDISDIIKGSMPS